MKEPRPWDEVDPALIRLTQPHGKVVTLNTVRERERLMAGLDPVEMKEEDPQT